MTLHINVKKKQQSIVPIRFCRAVANDPPGQSSDPVRDAPDVDDRGFHMGNRPAAWGHSDAHGAMIAIREGDTVKVKVLRTDIDDAADLYVSSTDTSVIEIISPVAGTALPTGGPNANTLQIRGVEDKRNTPIKVQIHFGAENGPVIGELEPHIYQEVSLSVAFHMVSIHGTAVGKNAADAQTLLTGVNDIWRPCGIQFTLNNANIFNETIRAHPTNVNRSQYQRRPGGAWTDLPHRFSRAGYVTSDERWTNAQGGEWRESDMIESVNPVNVSININWVPHSASYDNSGTYTDGDWNGLSGVGMPRRGGLCISGSATKYDLAHEIGHFLNLNHSDENAAGTDMGGAAVNPDKNIWLVRRLMFSDWPANTPNYRRDVGYGNDQYGALISVKKLGGTYSNADGDLARSRRHGRTIV